MMALPECTCYSNLQIVEYYTSVDARGNDIHIIHLGDCPLAQALLQAEIEYEDAVAESDYEDWIIKGGMDEHRDG